MTLFSVTLCSDHLLDEGHTWVFAEGTGPVIGYKAAVVQSSLMIPDHQW